MEGSLKVRDLPAVWADKMQTYLGIAVPDDASGVLQDMHWSSGYVGTFPTYTIGNIMAAQLFAAATGKRDVQAGLDTGDYAPLHAWLADNVHRHGRSLLPVEIIRKATGKELGTGDYVEALRAKVAAFGG